MIGENRAMPPKESREGAMLEYYLLDAVKLINRMRSVDGTHKAQQLIHLARMQLKSALGIIIDTSYGEIFPEGENEESKEDQDKGGYGYDCGDPNPIHRVWNNEAIGTEGYYDYERELSEERSKRGSSQ